MQNLLLRLIDILKIDLLHLPEQCQWSKWMETWACSKTCGRGARRIVRHNCKETQEKSQSCNIKPCQLGNITIRLSMVIPSTL